MDRARRAAASSRRKVVVELAPSQKTSLPKAASEGNLSLVKTVINPSPTIGLNSDSPQPAAQGRRGSKPNQVSSSLRSQASRKRSRTMDSPFLPDDDLQAETQKKGGHSLRKRSRVDYTNEQIGNGAIVPGLSSSSRSKKRKTEAANEAVDLLGPHHQPGAGLSSIAEPAAGSRRNFSRRSTAATGADEEEDDIKDTIEVGVSYPNPNPPFASSTQPLVTHSSGSSSNSEADHPAGPTCSAVSINSKAPTLAQSPQDADAPADAQSNGASALYTSAATAGPQLIPNQTEAQAQLQGQLSLLPVQPAKEPLLPALRGSSKDDPNVAPAASQVVDSMHCPPGSPRSSLVPSPSLLPSAPQSEGEPTSPGSDANPTLNNSSFESPQALPSLRVRDAPTAASLGQRKLHPPASSSSGSAMETLDLYTNGDDAGQGSRPPSRSLGLRSRGEPVTDPILELLSPVPAISVTKAPRSSTNASLPASGQATAASSTLSTKSIPFNGGSAKQRRGSGKANGKSPLLLPTPPDGHPPPDAAPPPDDGESYTEGRWSHLTPYVEGEFERYPEKKFAPEEEDAAERRSQEEKDVSGLGPTAVEEKDDAAEAAAANSSTPSRNTPAPGASPAIDSCVATVANSSDAAEEEGSEAYAADSNEAGKQGCYKYPKIRPMEDFLAALEDCETMSTPELMDLLQVINTSLVEWQSDYAKQGRIVDDYENGLRRRQVDAKYEAKTRDLSQPGVNYEEPDFVLKGYKAREKDRDANAETRHQQDQDRIMAVSYGFEYDPHPAKIGRQNPGMQKVGVMTRGRALRNQPRQTAKATETEEVTGKRQRKPVQPFQPAPREASRSATPGPSRLGKRRMASLPVKEESGAGPETDDSLPKAKRRRDSRGKATAAGKAEKAVAAAPAHGEPVSGTRSGRTRVSFNSHQARSKLELQMPAKNGDLEEEDVEQPERFMLTLYTKGKKPIESDSQNAEDGDSRPSTSSSTSSLLSAESSYSLRPNRQKHFRDSQRDGQETGALTGKKKGQQASFSSPVGNGGDADRGESSSRTDAVEEPSGYRRTKIRLNRSSDGQNGTSAAQLTASPGEDLPKEYSSMTKSEKMSASMKSRWANGNMAGAVQKRKATLAAKKAAQVAADQKAGIATTRTKIKTIKRDVSATVAASAASRQSPDDLPQQAQSGLGNHSHTN